MPTRPQSKERYWLPPKEKVERKHAVKSKNYNSVRWRKLRAMQMAEQPLCVSCKEKGIIKEARVADHIKPVRLGGEFWSRNNLQSLCDSCHNVKSGKEAKYFKGVGGVILTVTICYTPHPKSGVYASNVKRGGV